MMPRFSMLPGKQAIYILLARDSRLSEGKTVGVDFGCGAMLNRRIFRTAEYWGVDADKPTLEKGMRRHPEARGVLSKIEDADVPPADFAICINVFFGTNFEKATDEVVVLDSIIRKISPGGTLLVTFAPKRAWRDMIDKLAGAFSHVTQIGLDLPNRPQTPLAPLIAVRHLRNTSNPQDWPPAKHSDRDRVPAKLPEWRRIYCRCEGKVGV